MVQSVALEPLWNLFEEMQIFDFFSKLPQQAILLGCSQQQHEPLNDLRRLLQLKYLGAF